jgi:radial spoke head protein 4A
LSYIVSHLKHHITPYHFVSSSRVLAGNFQSARFFGKIMGTQKDYYVVEASLTSYPKEDVDAQTKKEPAGTGANAYVYFVANSPTDAWVRLPDVLPEQIVTSRSMRRYLTGVLSAPVLGYPRFPWPEQSYLRAQISRIAAATVVSPKGIFEMAEAPEEAGEDAPEVMVKSEEPEIADADGLKEAENWCHHVAQLLKQGRCLAWAPPEGEDEEEEEPPAEEEEEEEPEEALPMLSGLEGDVNPKPPVGEDEEEEEEEEPPSLWRFALFPANTLHRVNAAFCLNWPGAVSVAQGKQFANIYIGWGQKQLQSLYAPPAPPSVNKEFVSPFNPEEAEEGETDPLIEQLEPQPPKVANEDGDEGDNEGDDDDDEE